MAKTMKLSDFNNPLVLRVSNELAENTKNKEELITNIFLYVRDSIKFGFPDNGDFVKASETIQLGYGQCNTKSTLFLALCNASNINARIHFSLIKKEIQRGLITGMLYNLIPKNISHSWIEVQIDGSWVKIDSFINDRKFYQAGKEMLKEKKWDTGFSVSCSKNASSIDLDLINPKFVQMDAVTEDHGVYEEPMDYYNTRKYKNRPNILTLFIYRIFIRKVNLKIQFMRDNFEL